MKKLIMTAAVVACASIVSAQVASDNIVGYNKDIGATGFHMSGYAFNSADTSPQGAFGDQLPLGSRIYSFNGATYDISTYSSVFDYGTYTFIEKWDPNTLDLSGAKGFWVELPSAATAILSGEVELAATVTTPIAAGFQMLSSPYPVATAVGNLGLSPALGDRVYSFNGATYDISTYSSVFDYGTYTFIEKWDPDTLTIDVGEGFWYEAGAAQSWVAVRPFTP